MGTTYAVTVSKLPDGLLKSDLGDKLTGRLDVVNQQMSTWDPESEISRFNQSESTDWFPISAEFLEVVVEAKRIYEVTDGAFDPTVSPVIDLWGFGDKRPKAIPTDDQIESALGTIGMKHIQIQNDPPAIKKLKSQIQLNLSAIAKGYGVDDLAETLQELGIRSYLVDIGGETRAGAAKPDGSPWRLGIESALGGLQQIVPLSDGSMATSGDYRNFFEIDGKRYSHAINPVTGRPVEDPAASVSVRHASCMTADAFATALMVMNQQDALRLAKAEGLSVLFQRVNEAGAVDLAGTGSMVPEEPAANPTQSSGEETTQVATETPKTKSEQADQEQSSIWVPFVAAAVLFLLAVGAMSLGTMIQNRQIKGSCGGLASLPGHDGKSACDMCSIPRDQCTNAEVKERIRAMAEESEKQCQDEG
ncbi:UNVERIFIED_CONTAM: hypothetical protein GTU68_053191 [Idotea baltica]|nr:hypothetical protein [Idotea baltica]